MRHHTVTPEEKGMRLDQYLARTKPDLTRNFIQKMIKDGAVFINGKKTTKVAHKLSEKDELIVMIPSVKEVGLVAEKIPLKVIYEDEDLIVINKPPGMVTHPTDHGAHVSGTLVNAVMYHCKDLSGIGGEKRPGIVHRLDKDTSGIIVVAKNNTAHAQIAKQFQERKTTKRYVALLKGHLSPATGSIEASLLKGHGKAVKISGVKSAKYALTHYKVLKYVANCSLVEVTIVTGRTHQIRVHFAAIGHPVAGDETYGDPGTNETLEKAGLKRQFLHAAYLKFKHPKKNQVMELKAPLPKDLETVLKTLSQ